MTAERGATTAADPVELDTTSEPAGAEPADVETPWQRLDLRKVWVDATKLLLSIVPSVVGIAFVPSGPLWPLLIVSAWGVLLTVRDFLRWLTTRYRVTGGRIEMRRGLLVREYRHVPRDRIRTVDSNARLLHRIARLRTVYIGTGEARMSATFKLDAVAKEKAEELRGRLLPVRHDEPAGQEVFISGVRWYWVFYNMFRVWAFLAVALIVNTTYWFLDSFGVDLLAIGNQLISRVGLGRAETIAFGVVATFVLGFIGLAVEFVLKYGNFELVRTTEKGGALLTRHGLLTTQSVYREDRRIRGIQLREPLLWRWLRLTETKVVTTGIHLARDELADVLPRSPIGAAMHVSRYVLPDGFLPLEAPLLRHPLSALRRRLVWATLVPATVAGMLAWLGSTSGVSDGTWLVPLAFLPVTWALAVVAYFALGHTLVGPYLVLRGGGLNRSTVALQNRAVIGWTLRETIFQRLSKRITIGVPTAAGSRHYRLSDAGMDQALAFIRSATPWLADELIEGGSASASCSIQMNLDHPRGGFGSGNAAH